MTRPKQILALLTSIAALTAFAPAASAASEDGRYRVASVKPSVRVMVVPARMSAAKYSAARKNAAKYSAAGMRVQKWSEPVRS